MQEPVKFKLYGLTATVNFFLGVDDLGLSKGPEKWRLQNPPMEEQQRTWVCQITGRRDGGKGRIYKTCGMSILHPTDLHCYNEEEGQKLAFLDAIKNLYMDDDEIASWYMTREQYVKIWWSAYQRATHHRADLECTNDERVLCAFS